ncbi:PREDICTED: LIM domain transcription factor LMO4-like isoform X1 [Branchiostoma belcheri]|uniref:LIM domain transcription factor LMO4-like isoform X1 n=1 Tax=Branchiostoma belcheri TaxID=7741 RepID=A0A6P4XRK9_BRABE|nr:PREDICTED: LIM domain transcription factor LMO4-like isoform X1 [Branchiostoma belcheri]
MKHTTHCTFHRQSWQEVFNIEGQRPAVVPSRGGGGPMTDNGSVKKCAGCGGKIGDRFLLHALDRYWHVACLKCSCCQAQLGDLGSSCFSKAGMILCKTDYIRLFGASGACNACGQSIPANEFVMRTQGNVYHVKCFTCFTCRYQLSPGDRYHFVNGRIFCEQDGTNLLKGAAEGPPTQGLRPQHKVC